MSTACVPSLHIEGLSYSYGQDFCVRLPELTVSGGRPCALTGVSGSGKSTLLECIGLLQPATAVTGFTLNGQDIISLSEARKAALRQSTLGFMPQQDGLIPFLNLQDNWLLQVKLAQRARGQQDKAAIQQRMEELTDLAEQLGIGRLLRHLPGELSSGQKQRASFIRAIAHKPALLLIDEPTSALDPDNAAGLFALIRELTEQLQLLTLVVTHDLHNVQSFVRYTYDEKQSKPGLSIFTRQD